MRVVGQRTVSLSRAAVLRRLLAAASLPSLVVLPSSPASAASDAVLLPLSLCGGAYCIEYTLDSQRFRAVVDTGSPFLLVDGSCAPDDTLSASRWGCYRGAGRDAGLEDTYEQYAGEDVGVQWRRGSLSLGGGEDGGASLTVSDAVFGVVRAYKGKGGGGAIFLGLTKAREPRIRPTFLEQTRVAAMRFDFLGRQLTLSRAPLIDRGIDAVPLLDLRPRGAPTASYVCRISRMTVNGRPVVLDRAAVAVIDTGTTGISLPDDLMCSGRVPLPMTEASIELMTERGKACVLDASVRRLRRGETGPPPPEAEEFPLITTEVHVPWFEKNQSAMQSLLARRDGLGDDPLVFFVGMAFLWRRELTIDIDSRRMRIV